MLLLMLRLLALLLLRLGEVVMLGRRGGIDGEVLVELRAIREEIHALSERVAQSATREDLADYVTKEVFVAHVEAGRRATDLWNRWLPIGLAGAAFTWSIISPYLHFAAR